MYAWARHLITITCSKFTLFICRCQFKAAEAAKAARVIINALRNDETTIAMESFFAQGKPDQIRAIFASGRSEGFTQCKAAKSNDSGHLTLPHRLKDVFPTYEVDDAHRVTKFSVQHLTLELGEKGELDMKNIQHEHQLSKVEMIGRSANRGESYLPHSCHDT